MPITPYLRGQVFDPEIVRTMSFAFQRAREALGLRLTDDPATRLVAEKVIELTTRSVRDADTLRAMVLKEFNHEA